MPIRHRPHIDNIIDYLEEDNISERESKQKKFWSFLKLMRKDSSGVAPCVVMATLSPMPPTKQPSSITNLVRYSPKNPEDQCQTKGLYSLFPAMPDIDLSTSGVQKLLDNLKPHKASIPSMVLKELSNEIAPLLEIIFRRSFTTGQVPEDWKEANEAPIFKKGDKHKPSNYRPVSLTCTSSKIMEHSIVSNMMKHLEIQNILFPLQHGFRRNHSCESQLLSLVQDVASCTTQTDMLIMDFNKAFDKVPHKRLNYKLSWYGIRGDTLGWISNFLFARSQRVVLDGASSDSAPVLSGVPQDTVLGPILFLIYINDLPDGVENSTVRLFADDCIIYRPIRNKKDTDLLQSDLDAVGSWENTRLMQFYADKCFIMRTGKSKKLTEFTHNMTTPFKLLNTSASRLLQI